MARLKKSHRQDWSDAQATAIALGGVLLFLVIAVGAAWFVDKRLEIDSEAFITALLILPVVLFLILSGQLGEIKGFGLEARFREHVESVGREVTRELQIEPERATFLGKLKQLLEKERNDFCVLYADIDKLREITRRLYLDCKDKSRSRRTEGELRKSVIDHLAFALADAFYERDEQGSKYDLFTLEEPDIAMIMRGMSPAEAREIAEQALRKFPDIASKEVGSFQFSATVAVLSTAELTGSAGAMELDDLLAGRLRQAKSTQRTRGRVYPPQS